MGGAWGKEGQRSYFHPFPLWRLQIVSAVSAEGPELPECRRFQRRRVMKGRLVVAARVPSPWVAGPALFILRVPWQGVPARCLHGSEAGLAEAMQSSLGGFQPNCPAAALEE